jgi:hypothetical protein
LEQWNAAGKAHGIVRRAGQYGHRTSAVREVFKLAPSGWNLHQYLFEIPKIQMLTRKAVMHAIRNRNYKLDTIVKRHQTFTNKASLKGIVRERQSSVSD